VKGAKIFDSPMFNQFATRSLFSFSLLSVKDPASVRKSFFASSQIHLCEGPGCGCDESILQQCSGCSSRFRSREIHHSKFTFRHRCGQNAEHYFLLLPVDAVEKNRCFLARVWLQNRWMQCKSQALCFRTGTSRCFTFVVIQETHFGA
jgi:hypothetical protein